MAEMTPEQLEAYYRKNPDMRDVARLRQLLDEQSKRPSVMTLAQFEQFLPLFQEPPVFTDQRKKMQFEQTINRLTRLYREQVDLFKALVVVSSETDNTVVVVIPPTFMTLAPVNNDPASLDAVARYRKDGGSDIPARVDRAEAGIYEAIRRAQNSSGAVEKQRDMRRNTLAAFDEFKRRKQGGIIPQNNANSATPDHPPKKDSGPRYDPDYGKNTSVEFL